MLIEQPQERSGPAQGGRYRMSPMHSPPMLSYLALAEALNEAAKSRLEAKLIGGVPLAEWGHVQTRMAI